MSDRKKLFIWAELIFALWVLSSQATFALRHPWATSTERLMYFWTAATYGSVDYETTRPRGEK